MAVVDAQMALALAWVKPLLQLEQLPDYSEEQVIGLRKKGTHTSVEAWFDDGGDGSFVFRK